MTSQMADPHVGMLSFQEALREGDIEISAVKGHSDLYGHLDIPEPGTARLTYVWLTKNRKTVKAFVACVMNGQVDGHPCVAVGYAVPEKYRNKGYAKKTLSEVIQDQILQAGRNGFKGVVIEAVIDESNLQSQRVAEAVLQVERESIVDSASKKPAYRYTAHFGT